MKTMNHSSPPQQQSVFLIETDKIKPNPYQPRREFEPAALQGLAESIRQYGVLQPLVVVRKEEEIETGTMVQYELIAGERRLRAAQVAGLKQVPVIIRKEPTEKVKLELALIENLQRKDLNSMERAKAFKQLMEEFSLRHMDIGNIVGKSREYVSNTIRLLLLPQLMQQALIEGKISEGHTRPLLMLIDKPEEQQKLFFDIVHRNVSVREAEQTSRRVAIERARRRDTLPDPDSRTLETRLSEVLGTRVVIERKGLGGKLLIDFFSEEDLRKLFSYIHYRPGELHPVLARVSVADSAAQPAAPNTRADVLLSAPPSESIPPTTTEFAPDADVRHPEKPEADSMEPAPGGNHTAEAAPEEERQESERAKTADENANTPVPAVSDDEIEHFTV